MSRPLRDLLSGGRRDPRGLRVLVTGASGTFGRALCVRLRDAGARVAGLDARPGDDDPVGAIACDITDDDAVPAAVAEALTRLGGLDLLVNNAGIGGPAPAELPPGAEVRRQLDVNLLGAWRVTAAALPALTASRAERGGRRARVVFVASELAYVTLPFVSAYSVAKRGMSAYADALRLEYGTELHVTTVYPGYVRTGIHAAGREVGLSLEGQVRREEVEDVVGTVLRVLGARRPPRDTACTRAGNLELWAARHLPGVVGAVAARQIRKRAAEGRFDGSPLAAGLVARLTGRTPERSPR